MLNRIWTVFTSKLVIKKPSRLITLVVWHYQDKKQLNVDDNCFLYGYICYGFNIRFTIQFFVIIKFNLYQYLNIYFNQDFVYYHN